MISVESLKAPIKATRLSQIDPWHALVGSNTYPPTRNPSTLGYNLDDTWSACPATPSFTYNRKHHHEHMIPPPPCTHDTTSKEWVTNDTTKVLPILPPCIWAAWYITRLLVKSTPKGIVFSDTTTLYSTDFTLTKEVCWLCCARIIMFCQRWPATALYACDPLVSLSLAG